MSFFLGGSRGRTMSPAGPSPEPAVGMIRINHKGRPAGKIPKRDIRQIKLGAWGWTFAPQDVRVVQHWIERGDLGVRRERSGRGRGFEDFTMGTGDYGVFLEALGKLDFISQRGRLTDWNERGAAWWTGRPTPDGVLIPPVVQLDDDDDGTDDDGETTDA
jgi:hypothetical protein